MFNSKTPQSRYKKRDNFKTAIEYLDRAANESLPLMTLIGKES